MSRRIRIATFNVENLDDSHAASEPSLDERIAVLRPQLMRLNADIVCLQEVHGQKVGGQPRQLLALARVLEGTPYAEYHQAVTTGPDGQIFDQRNLVILSSFPIVSSQQYRNDLVRPPQYRMVTAVHADPQESDQAKDIIWERPILHAAIELAPGLILNLINVHLKSKNPTSIPGQTVPHKEYIWRSIGGWAEGYFLSSMKRVGQAFEVRRLIDNLFDDDPDAWIVAAGDCNSDLNDVPLQTLRGDVENTSNAELAMRIMVPCERTIPEPARFSLLYQGRGEMLDHLLISRGLLAFYQRSEIHNEILHDELAAFADDRKFPEFDHAPVIAEFLLPDV